MRLVKDRRVYQRLVVLEKLQDDWDSYGAKAVTQAAIKTAKEILSSISVFPRTDGGLIIELGDDIWEIEISPEGVLEEGDND